jgi:hypothetical protein
VALHLGQLIVVQPGQRPPHVLADHLAVGDHHRAAGARRAGLVVGHHDDRLALVGQLLEQFEDRLRRAAVQVARRLVGDDQRRVIGQGASDGHPLLLAAGDGRRPLARLLGHAHSFQQAHGPLAPLGRRKEAVDVHR